MMQLFLADTARASRALAIMILAGLPPAALAQSGRDVIQQRALHCLLDKASPSYGTETCVAFRDGVLFQRDYARDVLATGTRTRQRMIVDPGSATMARPVQADTIIPGGDAVPLNESSLKYQVQ